ncbi:Wzz/FepE/Etk N-terminal domain-containing protein [Roseateles cellulosilyticus]|uniref:Wzz/FepE/Etk N-terminal domain-containing protein n=1 Tax=Pelomonas cellulosilytica TaxID=2906762 RepID=A0ABS8XZL2_9BURK|nr:Wzz/FepE/Etk N-terminal domain-containing protein [Pelomonas sp. P8]MCE4558034.1 Wzz/FepE/Etk N-terminal domain-containing protein [Pelomonas sp. P8]
MQQTLDRNVPHAADIEESDISLGELVPIVTAKWKQLVGASLAVGAVALGVSYLIPPTFTARTMFLPPQQPQSAAVSALASLGALSGLAGGSLGGVKTTADQYVSLMQSVNVQDRLVDRFKLMSEYESKYRFEARNRLTQNVRITLGKKDGLITVEADGSSPQLAADLANAHVSELRRLTGELALTEAQQRRAFFEAELKKTRDQLAHAQQDLQQSGFNPGALKTEPKAAAEAYARMKAEATTAEVRLQTMRRSMAESSAEVQQQQTLLAALRTQLTKLESADRPDASDAGYISRYREYKYQESLFELFSRQFEAARLDESKEGGLIQVVDAATPPEYKSKPKRAFIAVGAAVAAGLLMTVAVVFRHFRIKSKPSA